MNITKAPSCALVQDSAVQITHKPLRLWDIFNNAINVAKGIGVVSLALAGVLSIVLGGLAGHVLGTILLLFSVIVIFFLVRQSMMRKGQAMQAQLETHQGIMTRHEEMLETHQGIMKRHEEMLETHQGIMKRHEEMLEEAQKMCLDMRAELFEVRAIQQSMQQTADTLEVVAASVADSAAQFTDGMNILRALPAMQLFPCQPVYAVPAVVSTGAPLAKNGSPCAIVKNKK